MIGKAIYEILSTDAEVSALISSRIYPAVLPMGIDFPAAVYQVVSVNPTGVKAQVVQEDFVLDVLVADHTYDAAVSLGEKVKAALNRKKGVFAGITIQRCNYINKNDDYDKDNNLFIRTITFSINQTL
tara:strand:+ start:7548 stop:7931 length:384 start_codon:yes stop_codon:yes gene_type:complete